MKNIEFVVLFRKGSARKINNMGDFALIEGIKGVYGDKIHPSEKPVPLFQKFVENSTNEGDIVLEPFIGCGTLARACQRTNRHFVGFELNKEYFDRAVKRINDERRQLSLF
jgi:site-specific DNA-methyltransferase (adenine-specific)